MIQLSKFRDTLLGMLGLLVISACVAESAFGCPSGQYEQCVLRRPWPSSGCAQHVCIPNGGTVVRGLTQGLIEIGDTAFKAPENLKGNIESIAMRIDPKKIEGYGTALMIASFIANGAACIASDGASPGLAASGNAIMCSENACACALISLGMAISSRTDMSPDDRQSEQLSSILNDETFNDLSTDPNMYNAAVSGIQSLKIERHRDHGNGGSRPKPARP